MVSHIPKVEDVVKSACELFRQEFNAEPEFAGCGPGRVNLIGEHTDYNDGFVLPMALPMVTICVGRPIDEGLSKVVTKNDQVDGPFHVEFVYPSCCEKQVLQPGKPQWANYVKGVVANFIGEAPAFEAAIVTSVPTGGGLSSSAAIEVAVFTFLEALTGSSDVNLVDKAFACQRAEHEFAHVPCGIMDPFISVMGKEGSALLIDCRSITSELVPMDDPDIVIIVINSNVKHELLGTEYSSRQDQCKEAANLLGKSLRDATPEDVQKLESLTSDQDVIKRAKHAISETIRTAEAAEALKMKDFKKFGKLMVESHVSLRDDFEVSCPELNTLVEAALEICGVYGSRMTGGGFGGCTVTMVHRKAVDNLVNNIIKKYNGTPTIFVCTASDGARIIDLKN